MHLITRAMSIHYINGKGHKLELRKNKNYLTNGKSRAYTYVPPVIYGPKDGHTYAYTCIKFNKTQQARSQFAPCSTTL